MKWEYKVVDLIKEIQKERTKKVGQWLNTSDLEKILDKLGLQGWELVDIFLDRQESIIVGFFKRSF